MLAKVPARVGVPEIVGGLAVPLKVSPVGRVPVCVTVYGGAPPLTAKVCEYATPTVAAGSEPGPSDNVATDGAITTVYVCCATCGSAEESTAANVNVKLAAVFGVPLSMPCRLSVRPVGSVPVTNPNETVPPPPVVATLALYGAPTVPPGKLAVVILSGAATEMPTTCVTLTGGVEESVA